MKSKQVVVWVVAGGAFATSVLFLISPNLRGPEPTDEFVLTRVPASASSATPIQRSRVVEVHHHVLQASEPQALERDESSTDSAPGSEDLRGGLAAPPSEAERSAFADSVFQDQQRDVTWAAPTETELQTRLEQIPAIDIAVTEIECRTSLCRVVVEAEDAEAALEYSHQVRHTGAWEGPGMLVRAKAGYEPTPGEPFFMTFFFAQEGTALPVSG